MNYTVKINEKALKTYECSIFQRPYNSQQKSEYVMLAFKGKTELVIESEIKVKSVRVRPKSANIKADIRSGKIYVTIDKPAMLSVEINGGFENNLMIFAHEKEYQMPCGNVIAVRKGEVFKGTLSVKEDNTVVYLEEGALLDGNICAENCENLTICGLGRICMENYSYEMRKFFKRSVDITGCRNVKIDGIIIDDSNDWSLRINGCDDVEIKNVKIFGCRGNSDGIDVCGSRNVTVSNIFTRVWDDSFVVKALDTGDCENVVFKNSVLWNDFARPLEVGVELRADSVRNIRFENIDIIHSSTGYPVMGIHHGDHARVRNIIFKDIRIEDAPGAQLFDVRITNSAWNRDDVMGDIRGITFSDIEYIGDSDNGVLLSNSRIEGFDGEHDIRDVSFHNIVIKGRAAQSAEDLGLDIYDYAENVSVTSDLDLPCASHLPCEVREKKSFAPCGEGKYFGSVGIILKNDTEKKAEGSVRLAVSPKNTQSERTFSYSLMPGESADFEAEMQLGVGKYVFFLKSDYAEIENKFLYKEICGTLGNDLSSYSFVNYYGDRICNVAIGAKDDMLVFKNESQRDSEFVLYTAEPCELSEGEVLFSAEETDFGEVCAYVNKNGRPTPAPQLRCPAEITFVFKNEPKVKEIVKTKIFVKSAETVQIPLKSLGISGNGLLLEVAALMSEVSHLRYPYTLFHSTMPDKTAHMFGKFKIVK